MAAENQIKATHCLIRWPKNNYSVRSLDIKKCPNLLTCSVGVTDAFYFNGVGRGKQTSTGIITELGSEEECESFFNKLMRTYMLVTWTKEGTISIMNKSSIVDCNQLHVPQKNLEGVTTSVRFGRKVLEATIEGFSEEKSELEGRRDLLIHSQNKADSASKAANIAKTLACVSESQDCDSQNFNLPHSQLPLSSMDYNDSQENHQTAEMMTMAENASLKRRIAELEAQLDESSRDSKMQLPGGIFIERQRIEAARIMSQRMTTLARNLVRLLFKKSELDGYSLTGRGCAANKHCLVRPAIDQKRLFAVIEYVTEQYAPKSMTVHNEAARDAVRSRIKSTLTDMLSEINNDKKKKKRKNEDDDD